MSAYTPYQNVTISFSLPRSRSQWLAWLYRHAIDSWHDPFKNYEHPVQLKYAIDEWMKIKGSPSARLFIADTSAILFYSQICKMLPGALHMFVVRPVDECMASMKRGTGMSFEHMLRPMHRRLVEKSTCRTTLYENIEGFARRNYGVVTGEAVPFSETWWHEAFTKVVDVPMDQQGGTPERFHKLLKHSEIDFK